MAFKPRFSGKTARVVLSIIERKLRAGEPLSELHSAIAADALKAMREGASFNTAWGLSKVRGAKRKNLARDIRIAERFDALTKDCELSDRSAFHLLESEFNMKASTIQTAYDAVKSSYEYAEHTRNKTEPFKEPDYS